MRPQNDTPPADVLVAVLPWAQRHPEVTVHGSSARRVDGVRAYRTRSLDARDVVLRACIRVTSPARTLLDLAAVLPPRALRRAVRRGRGTRVGPPAGPDFRWRDARLVLEADGAQWHDHRLARGRRHRRALPEAGGYRVLRITREQAVRRPQQTLARIRSASYAGG